MARVKARKDEISGQSRTGVESWLRGLAELHGPSGPRALRVGPHELRVGDDRLTAERIFINVGGRAQVPPMPGHRGDFAPDQQHDPGRSTSCPNI